MRTGNPHLVNANKYLKLSDTPFYLQSATAEWPALNNKPRIGGVSSFGFGGSNAHVIIAEYQSPATAVYTGSGPAIIVLSAKNQARLKDRVQNLVEYLSDNAHSNLYDIAYTLQVGRDAMDERLALVVNNREELLVQLGDYLEGRTKSLLTGNVRKNTADFLLEGEAGKAYIKIATENKESKSLAQLWVKGVNIDWSLLYPAARPNRISLPTYPFARDRYWVARQEVKSPVHSSIKLHPLLHSNCSNLKQQLFTSIYSGEESFLCDSKIGGAKIFPGVACLELARVAGEYSLALPVTSIEEVSWVSPVIFNGASREVHISLYEQGEDICFDVFTHNEDKTEQLHCQGRLTTGSSSVVADYNMRELQSRFTNNKDGQWCYDNFKNHGLDYGPSFRGIQVLHYNAEEALSRISLPADTDYVLTPGVLDSALQTCIGLSFNKEDLVLELPFNVGAVTIYKELPETVWSYVRRSSGDGSQLVNSYDIDILNEAGQVLVSISGFTTLPAQGSAAEPADLHLYTPVWRAAKADATGASAASPVVPQRA
jgi:acyl transferase domain-containing protein